MKSTIVNILILLAFGSALFLYVQKFRGRSSAEIDEFKYALGDFKKQLNPDLTIGVVPTDRGLEMTGWIQYVVHPVKVVPHGLQQMDTVLFVFDKGQDSLINAQMVTRQIWWQTISDKYHFIATVNNKQNAQK